MVSKPNHIDNVIKYPGLSDHFAVKTHLAVPKTYTTKRTSIVTSRIVRAVNLGAGEEWNTFVDGEYQINLKSCYYTTFIFNVVRDNTSYLKPYTMHTVMSKPRGGGALHFFW